MAVEKDLAETVRQVEALDRRVIAVKADVRSQDQLNGVVEQAFTHDIQQWTHGRLPRLRLIQASSAHPTTNIKTRATEE
jgi:hypothetical protein